MSNKTAAQPQRILNKISEYVIRDFGEIVTKLKYERCRERGDFTDFSIVCEGVDFYVH